MGIKSQEKCAGKAYKYLELTKTVNRLCKKHENCLISPNWETREIEVQYKHWKLVGVNEKQKAILLRSGWPQHMLKKGGWRNWGGLTLKTATVIAVLVKVGPLLMPLAIRVVEDSKHNALCQRQLLLGHGFPTDVGLYKTVNSSTVIDKAFIKPFSNKFRLPRPDKWFVQAL